MKKFEIKGKGPALKGFVINVINEDQFEMVFQGSYFYSKEGNTNYYFECFINRLLSEKIFPIVIQHISTKSIREKLKIDSIRVNMFSDFRKNVILVNGTGLTWTVTTDNEHNLQSSTYSGEQPKGGITAIKVQERDPNAAIIALSKYCGRWYGFFDCVYNRKNAIEKHKRAVGFLDSSKTELTKKKYFQFYQATWDAFELYMEIMPLMHGDISVGASHETIKKKFEEFCESKALPFLRYFKTLERIREFSRYGPPHASIEEIDKEASSFLNVLIQLDKYVEDFLERRQVTFSNEIDYTIENITFNT